MEDEKRSNEVEVALKSLQNLPDNIDSATVEKIIDVSEEIAQIVETDCAKLSQSTLKRAIAQFDRRIKRNDELRIQNANDPSKFLKSEVDLDEEIKKFGQLNVMPYLLNQFVDLGGLQLLIAVLGHPNTDIAIEVVEVLSELTDPDNIVECPDPENFVNSLLKFGTANILADTLIRIKDDESVEEGAAVYNCLKIFENLTELRADVCDIYAKLPRLMQWLIQRIRHGASKGHTKADSRGEFVAVDHNRVYASELLCIMLQNSQQCRETFGRREGLDGIDRLLRSISVYRKKDPSSSEEEEFVGNLFGCLCSLVMVSINKTTFGQAQTYALPISKSLRIIHLIIDGNGQQLQC